MRQRFITAVFFTAFMLAGIYGGKYSFFALFLFITAGSLWELFGLLWPEGEDHRLLRRIIGTAVGTYPFCSMMVCQVLHMLPIASWFIAIISFIFIVPVAFFLSELYLNAREPFRNIGYYLLGLVYVGLPYLFLVMMATEQDYQPNRVFGLLWLVWTNDTMAYLIGSQIGKTKLFERISPKKTWEGTVGGIIFTMLMAWGLSHWSTDYTISQWIALGAVAGIFGTFGDLVESMLKRSLGVKDSGTLLPGHGGLLDRFDAFMFMLPFAGLVLILFR